MKAVVIGAGPVGLYTAVSLARSGHEVTIVDRDAGPSGDDWDRRGVMQFRHPHFFRAPVRAVFQETAPDLWDAVVTAGGVPCLPPGMPPVLTSLQCRRWVFERAVREVAVREPHVVLHQGHVEDVRAAGGRVSGVVVDGAEVAAELVIDASGRAGRIGSNLRAPGEGGACGFSYVSRMYQARPGVDELPDTAIPRGELHDGYLAILFPQDDRTLSTLIVRRDDDAGLAELRHVEKFDAAMAALDLFAPWTDPDRFEPITGVMPGGGLTNSYRGQLGEDGRAALPGMFWVGDALCTTNPAAGRGVSLGLSGAAALVSMLAADHSDPGAVAEAFQGWADANVRPWFEDHVYWDETLLRRFAGEDLDVEARIPSDVICAAAEVDPEIGAVAGPYLGMLALPTTLRPYEERARAVLRTGWRPPLAAGPSRADLVELIAAVPDPALASAP